MSDKPFRQETLEKALELTCGDRNKAYGPPFMNLSACAMLWTAYLSAKHVDDISLTAEDVAWMMTLLKMTRAFHGEMHGDNYIDAAAYSAIAGECRVYG